MGDWGLGIGPNPQSPIPNPQSPIPIGNTYFLSLLYNILIKNFNFEKMVKNKNKISKKNSSIDYQIKTRNRLKKLSSMAREVKNLQESDWFQKTEQKNSKPKGSNINKPRKKTKKKIKTDNEKLMLKNIKIILNDKNNDININMNKTGKNINQKKEHKKIYVEIRKYKYKEQEYFDFKEVLSLLNEQLHINLDSSNKIKDKGNFKKEMNEMLNQLFLIYFNKILITEENLNKFLDYLSHYIKLDTKEIIKLLNMKIVEQTIEENIQIEQYFKPRLVLVEK